MNFKLVVVCVLLIACTQAKIYFEENFNDGNFDGWVVSTSKGAEAGKWDVDSGKYIPEDDKDAECPGLKTTENNRFFQISVEMDEVFDNSESDLVLQFSVQNGQGLGCGGAYVKLLPPGIDQESFNGDTPYNVMFGPDVCGVSKRIHAIINNGEDNHLIKSPISYNLDIFTHVYTWIIHPDNTFEILFDGEEKRAGNIEDEWDVLPPKEIKDPEVSKPEDWVDEKFIDDPEDEKPEGWDDIPEFIPDPDAEMPEGWDAELDGEWEAPIVENPEYEGEWVAKKIPNPEYKGEWEHPLIPNPDYDENAEIANFKSKFIGIEIWQVEAGTIFDNFLVTDSVETAEEYRNLPMSIRDYEKDAHEEETKREASAAFGDADDDDDDDDSEAEFVDDWDDEGAEAVAEEIDDEETVNVHEEL